MDESKELFVFRHFYPKLCAIPDIDNLLKYLFQEQIISFEQHEELCCSIRKEKISKLLAIVSEFLQNGDNKKFKDVLRIMKTFGLDYTKYLANLIEKKLASYDTGMLY